MLLKQKVHVVVLLKAKNTNFVFLLLTKVDLHLLVNHQNLSWLRLVLVSNCRWFLMKRFIIRSYLVKPRIDRANLKSITVKVGQTVTIEAPYIGEPLPTMTWKRSSTVT